MASAVTAAASSHGRALHTCTASSRALAGWRSSVPARRAPPPRARVVVRASSAQRATWLPGLDPPAHLDGTLPGDYGFDPLGLGEEPASLKWYVQAELVHCRFAMAGVAGILFTDLLRVSGIRGDLPVWFEAGAAKFDFANTTSLFFVQLLLMGFAETKRYMDFINPGSQAEEGTFIGLEAALVGSQPGYPGGPLFNPLGFEKDIENAHEAKLKEIKNGSFNSSREAGNGSHAWLHGASICNSCWPHRQSFDTSFGSIQQKYHSHILLFLRILSQYLCFSLVQCYGTQKHTHNAF